MDQPRLTQVNVPIISAAKLGMACRQMARHTDRQHYFEPWCCGWFILLRRRRQMYTTAAPWQPAQHAHTFSVTPTNTQYTPIQNEFTWTAQPWL